MDTPASTVWGQRLQLRGQWVKFDERFSLEQLQSIYNIPVAQISQFISIARYLESFLHSEGFAKDNVRHFFLNNDAEEVAICWLNTANFWQTLADLLTQHMPTVFELLREIAAATRLAGIQVDRTHTKSDERLWWLLGAALPAVPSAWDNAVVRELARRAPYLDNGMRQAARLATAEPNASTSRKVFLSILELRRATKIFRENTPDFDAIGRVLDADEFAVPEADTEDVTIDDFSPAFGNLIEYLFRRIRFLSSVQRTIHRETAVRMGLHARLGVASPLRELDRDTIDMITRFQR